MKCIIVDDEIAAIKILENHLRKIPKIEIKYSFSDPMDALEYLRSHEIDLIFLDINMPQINGFDFMDLLKGKSNVILTTAYSEFAIEGYKYDVVDYLCKPIGLSELLKAIQKVEERGGTSLDKVQDFILVKGDHKGKFIKVAIAEILYIQAAGNYVFIYTLNEQRIITLLTLKELEGKLPAELFIRTHKTYIVSVNHIELIEGGELIIRYVKQRIPIGRTYRAALFDRFESKILSS
ncbi:LytR/AlgR family response regulator transcription factor [Leadbetterella byssophila]|uniref:LytR/AlgR family response regulator transcription factor n=1 Tax=Leadbetterella byssophila TaxID=316068 RepID=UPI0039A2DE3A